MKENDYIAEYIKEKRPEIITSCDFLFWRICRTAREALNGIAEALKNMDASELRKAIAAGEESEGGEDGNI